MNYLIPDDIVYRVAQKVFWNPRAPEPIFILTGENKSFGELMFLFNDCPYPDYSRKLKYTIWIYDREAILRVVREAVDQFGIILRRLMWD